MALRSRLMLPGLIAAALLTAPAAHACTGAGCYASVAALGESPATGSGVFRFPQAIAYSPGGSAVFAADQFSAVVQRFDRSGVWQRDFGFYADHGELGRIGVIGGLATDRNGHLFVLDSENDRVQVFDASSGAWLAAWGSRGTAVGQFRLGVNTGAGGLAIDQPTAGATAVAYVADQYNHRIQAFTLDQPASGDPTHPVLPAGTRDGAEPDLVPVPQRSAGWGSFGDCAAAGCGDPSFQQKLNYPQGVAVDTVADADGRRHVFVADDDNHRVVEYLPDGTFVRQVGSYGTANGQFRFPYDVGVDARNPRQLYVADNNNHRIQAFDAATLAFNTTWGGFGAQPGQLEFVRALAALADDPSGGVAVADTANNRVQTFDPGGALTAAWGIAGRGPGYVTRPQGVAVDAAGQVDVADTTDQRIERLGPDGAYRGQTAYVAQSSGFAAPGSGDGQFRDPAGIAFDAASGHLWVADTTNSRVQELGADGSWIQTLGGPGSAPGQFSGPAAVAVEAAGGVLVADTGNNRVQRRDPSTGAWSVVDLHGATVSAPAGIAAAAGGVVYVADTGGDRVIKVTASAATPVPAPPAPALDGPTGLFAAGSLLYVADTGNSRVLRLDTTAGTWDVLGTEGRALGSFVAPTGLATDASGTQLVVADTGNDRLQRITLSGAAPPTTVRLAATVGGTGRGVVTSDPAGISCPTDCGQGFTRDSTVTLTATPDVGSSFTGWEGPCSGTGPCVVTMSQAALVGAVFDVAPAPQEIPQAVPAAPPPSSGPAPRDRTAPTLRAVSIVPATFRPTRSGAAITAATARGALLRLTLSERATLTVRIARPLAGARVGGRCLVRTRTRRRAPRCTRFPALKGTSRVRLAKGARRLHVSGRLRGRALRAGAYRLVLVASDAAGHRSPQRRVVFRIR